MNPTIDYFSAPDEMERSDLTYFTFGSNGPRYFDGDELISLSLDLDGLSALDI